MMRLFACVALCAAPALAEVQFSDKTANLPHHEYSGGWTHFVGGGVAVFDCDANGLPDVLAAGGESAAVLLRNTGAFTFATSTPLNMVGVTGAYPVDIDNDGWQDLFVMRVGPNRVLRGGPACSFTDVTAAWGIPQTDQWTTAFTAWWEAGTGPHFALGNYVDRSNPDGPFEACDDNAILRPTDTGYDSTLLSPGYCPLSMLAGRDARGQHSLRISNDRHYYVHDGNEQLWDIAERRFLDAADGWARVKLWGMGIASRDLDGDARDEVMLTSMGDQLMQLAQADGTYAPAPFGIGTYAHRPHLGDDGRPSTGWHAEFGDIDNDGRADLFIAKGNVDQMPGNAMNDPNNLLMQNENGQFTEVSITAGVADTARSRGAALADFDGDGRLDLIVVNRRAQMRLYRNDTPDTGQWIGVDLAQDGANRHAIGATVTVNGQTLQRLIGGGHAGGSALPLHVGLGTANTADIQVTWPDGSISGHSAAAGQIITLTKP